MISINNVLYDEESKEADVELGSGDVSILCYCHPAENLDEIYKSINNQLSAFLTKDIIREDTHIAKAEKTNDGHYSYLLIGKVISDTKIQVNDFIIDIGVIPKDIRVGEYVLCSCLRLDIILLN